jgi:hypothetical protein
MFPWFSRKKHCPRACAERHTYGPHCLMVTSPRARQERLEALLGGAEVLPYLLGLDKHERR